MAEFDRENALKTAGGALVAWWRATTLDALIVGALWWLGLTLIGVPLAPLWGMLGGLLQFIPNFGPVLSVCGPALALLFTDKDWYSYCWLLGLYGAIAAIDGLLIQPYLLKRTARVPWWAAFFGPIVLGIIIPFWGVLLAPPLLAVIYAFRKPKAN
ncbi:AI-2E family transporter [Terriglobus albidus]|uniref:AI-2E family transporter n=1 Tax=Terriglobus albidus TaxID=1592106 RepID=UPI0021E02549|nr:AI-2E family transporter [Terriglobus albidus]